MYIHILYHIISYYICIYSVISYPTQILMFPNKSSFLIGEIPLAATSAGFSDPAAGVMPRKFVGWPMEKSTNFNGISMGIYEFKYIIVN